MNESIAGGERRRRGNEEDGAGDGEEGKEGVTAPEKGLSQHSNNFNRQMLFCKIP